MLKTPQEYIDTLEGAGKEWLIEFLSYMDVSHSHIKPVMFRQRPMFKAGKSYVFFTVAKGHFTVHTLDFDIVEGMKAKLPKAGYGKGCVKVKFSDSGAKPLLISMCDEIIERNG